MRSALGVTISRTRGGDNSCPVLREQEILSRDRIQVTQVRMYRSKSVKPRLPMHHFGSKKAYLGWYNKTFREPRRSKNQTYVQHRFVWSGVSFVTICVANRKCANGERNSDPLRECAAYLRWEFLAEEASIEVLDAAEANGLQ